VGGVTGGWPAGWRCGAVVLWCWTGEVCVEELKRLREVPGLGGGDSAHVKGRSRALGVRFVGGDDCCCCLEGLFGVEGRRALSRSKRKEGDRGTDCRCSIVKTGGRVLASRWSSLSRTATGGGRD
jgi:hypothetical protein